MRSSSAAACSPSSLATSACANGSNESPESGGPRHSASAACRRPAARSGSPAASARRPSSHNASNRSRSSSPGSRCSR